jgi:hypothetical protein
MYFIIIALFLLILPAGSVVYEMSNHGGDLIALIGKWFTFWAVGVRLGVAGLRQTFDPATRRARFSKFRKPQRCRSCRNSASPTFRWALSAP